MIVHERKAAGPDVKTVFSEYIRYTEVKRLIQQVKSELGELGQNSVAVLSEYPGEGKTFFVATLAIGFAQLLRKRVLVVDTTTQTQGGNLYLDRIFEARALERRPETWTAPLVDLISPKNNDGTSDESSDFDIGPIVSRYTDDYDLIIYDTCAMCVANKNNMDPFIIAKHAGSAVVIQTQRSLNIDAFHSLRDLLKSWDIKIAGTVFNMGPGRKANA